MQAAFADTFYWIALTNPDDLIHQQTLSLSRTLRPGLLITTEEVLDEYLAFFSGASRSVREHAGTMVASLIDNRKIIIVPQSHDSFMAGLRLYRARPDKGYSLTDCISMETMTLQRLTDVLTNDRHFEQEASGRFFARSKTNSAVGPKSLLHLLGAAIGIGANGQSGSTTSLPDFSNSNLTFHDRLTR